ncbi:MAG: KpsF/GutQ family sugar-phosphate isomerase [Desulfobacterales bacterium]|nr:KpsF/GutQ family sugar-phosphate isomerase [Desulfobacterales bacterium]
MIKEKAIEVLEIEAAGILEIAGKLDDSFTRVIKLILASRGRVIVSGIGKSGLIGKKIVATLNSTGTLALFLHPVEAMHGDLGVVSADDILLALSNSGETIELNTLIPSIKKVGCQVITLTGNPASTLAKNSDEVLDIGVAKEACPLGLAPTTSTTALLAMGDALAVVLTNKKDFKSSDFKRFHPGGALGQRLSNRIDELMLAGSAIPSVQAGESIRTAVGAIDVNELGAVFVVDAANTLIGILTDGDIRRFVARQDTSLDQPVDTIMTRNPRTLSPNAPAYDALNLMERHQITVLPVTGPAGEVKGLLHLHDILGKGEFTFNGK